MRTADATLQQQSLFIPGWLVAVVGGHILLLLLIFFLAAGPMTEAPTRLAHSELPNAVSAMLTPSAETLVPVIVTREGGWSVADRWTTEAELAARFERVLGAERSGILVSAHARAPWAPLKRGLQLALDAGALRIEIEVRTDDSRLRSFPLDVHAPLPELPDGARVQDLVDALAEGR